CLLGGIWLAARTGGGAAAAPTAARDCPLAAVARQLDQVPEPHTIVADLDFGPELLWRSKHRVLASPYHRNAQGILDAWQVLSGTADAAAQAILRRRQASWILLCPSAAEAAFFDRDPASLYHRLAAGQPPAWLAAEPLPPDVGGFQLYRVRDAG